ncbi:polysaccharide deacetylase family protein [Cellulomonas hominis]|uniref:polysaccharide deacetylase family protein n=1 Tax=Cellulomonas hominis TaxID=156981 RepID=UPI001B9560C5|nr:polysaccharide deacetylase family protein [Cellulomonas hominis]VTR78139.1 Peptidoglycan-N-acetylglucosamine deacetylase [Cellulomonas hominis]
MVAEQQAPTRDTGPTTRPGRDVLVLRRDLGEFSDPAARPLRRHPVLRVAAPLLRPVAPTVCVATAEPVLALTYDDGPDPAHTPGLLDVLAERGVRATFFVLADAADAHPALVRRIVAEGHELALHGADHARLSVLPAREAVAVVADARRRVEAVAGVPVTLFRPPYGAHTPATLRGWRRLGLEVVIWSGWAQDWVHGTEAEVTARARRSVHAGGVLLLHDTRADPETLGAGEELPRFDRAAVTAGLVDPLLAEGWRFDTVGGLLRAHPRVRSVFRELWS